MRVAQCVALLLCLGLAEALHAAPRVFIVGLGYVGTHLARTARDMGWSVAGTCRSADKAAALQAAGIAAHVLDLDDSYGGLDSGGLVALTSATHVVCTMPPVADLDRDPLLALHRTQLLADPPEWAGYLSTTSVYGDHEGEWVDEAAETRSSSPGSRSRLAAEREWLELREASGGATKSHVFRLAGIYGPGRSALDTVARAAAARRAADREATPGPPVADPPRPVSRVHVDDICAVLLASMRTPAASARDALYNVADDEPAPRDEVMAAAAALLGVPTPVDAAAAAAGGGGARSRRRGTESKRVANGRMRALLRPAGLAHPTYRQGLAASLASVAQEIAQEMRRAES